jgi:hypothetical protein
VRFLDVTGVAISVEDEDSCATCLRPQELLSPCRCCKVDLRRDEDLRGSAASADPNEFPAEIELAESWYS